MLLALSAAIRALLTARPKYCAWKATPSLRLLSVRGNQYSSSRPNSHAAASFVHNVAWLGCANSDDSVSAVSVDALLGLLLPISVPW